jgi:hypothetical protein
MPGTTFSAHVRPVIINFGLVMAILCIAPAFASGDDIAENFKMYYGQQVASGAYNGPLDFLQDAATAHANAEQVLNASGSRRVVVDRRHGYLQIDDSSGTDQILTMALYTKADGTSLLVVGSSNCADACRFSVQFFVASAHRLQPVAQDGVVPTTEPAQFIKPGHPLPTVLAPLVPSINYVPALVGTTLTLTPWYGYEVEEQMSSATRGAIRNVVLAWEPRQGRFVNSEVAPDRR